MRISAFIILRGRFYIINLLLSLDDSSGFLQISSDADKNIQSNYFQRDKCAGVVCGLLFHALEESEKFCRFIVNRSRCIRHGNFFLLSKCQTN